jgi:hypothetical protein
VACIKWQATVIMVSLWFSSTFAGIGAASFYLQRTLRLCSRSNHQFREGLLQPSFVNLPVNIYILTFPFTTHSKNSQTLFP